MGAMGSGRRPFSKCRTTDSVFCIDVRRWVREGRLATTARIYWRWTENGHDIRKITVCPATDALLIAADTAGGFSSYRIELTQTPCHLGGARTWFVCPAVGCGRRAAILYGGAVFACRHCYRLNYRSQRESPGNRAARRAEALRDRLGWPGGIFDGTGNRPKGMHRRTYRRLLARYEAAVGECLADARLRFGHDFLGSKR